MANYYYTVSVERNKIDLALEIERKGLYKLSVLVNNEYNADLFHKSLKTRYNIAKQIARLIRIAQGIANYHHFDILIDIWQEDAMGKARIKFAKRLGFKETIFKNILIYTYAKST